MELNMAKLQQAFDKVEETEKEKVTECFLEVVLSDSISIKELRERGYTPETLLQVAVDSMELVDELDRLDESFKSFNDFILEAPVIRGARKLF